MMNFLLDLWDGIDSRRKNHILYIIGAIIVIVFCIFAKLVWPDLCGKPDMALVGEAEITVVAGTEYKDAGVTATIRDKDVSDRVYTNDEIDTLKPGTYEVNFNVDGRWDTYTVTRTITIVDEAAPEITLKGDDVIVVQNFSEYKDEGATAMDNCDGDLTSKIQVNKETIDDSIVRITYTVADESGNETSSIREIRIPDGVGPQVSLNGEASITIKEQEKFQDPGVTATDERDGDISDRAEAKGYVDIYCPGTYTVTYIVTDKEGNEASVSREVVVEATSVTDSHTIYLTFDDGPSKEVTPQILDTLKKNGVQATFFICNYDEDKIPLLKRMIEEGHTIAIHGYSHDYDKIYASTDAFMENIHKLQDKLEQDTGYKAFAIRFPGGSSNTISRNYCDGIMTQLVQMVTAEGMQYYDWHISSGDAERGGRSAEQIYNNVTSELSMDHENIVLMHDIATKQTTADALQSIIDYGKANGYDFSAIKEDTAPIHQKVLN